MPEPLRQSIEATIALSDAEFALARAMFTPVAVRKKALLLAAGEPCQAIYFIERGALFSYAADARGDIHVVQFGIDGYWIADLSSFFSGAPALFTIEALTDSALLAIKLLKNGTLKT